MSRIKGVFWHRAHRSEGCSAPSSTAVIITDHFCTSSPRLRPPQVWTTPAGADSCHLTSLPRRDAETTFLVPPVLLFPRTRNLVQPSGDRHCAYWLNPAWHNFSSKHQPLVLYYLAVKESEELLCPMLPIGLVGQELEAVRHLAGIPSIYM